MSIAIAVALLVAAEAGVRAAADSLPDPLRWNDHEAQNKAQHMAELASRGRHVDIVFTGSSSMNAAADPRLLGRLAPGVSAYNAALNGADMRSMEFWLDHVVLPRLRPEVVVIGTTSLELNDNGITQRDFYRRLITSEAGRSLRGRLGRMGALEAWFEDHSYLARYRTELRRPATIINGDPRARAGEVDATGLLRAIPEFHARPYALPAEFKRRTERDSYHAFAIGGEQLAALARIADKLERRDISLVLVKMPVTNDLVPLHPRGARDYALFERTLSGFASSRPITYADADARFSNKRFFVDPIHLNAQGMRRFTAFIAPLVGG